MKKVFWSTVYWFYAVSLGIRNTHKTHLGSRVVYQDQIWFVNNGVIHSCWTLIPVEGGESVNAPREECKRLRGWREWKHSFYFMYRWWMTSWHSIYVNRKLYPEAFK